jgi:hypothetical protein
MSMLSKSIFSDFIFFLGQSSIREVIEIQRQVTEGIERVIRGRLGGSRLGGPSR